MEKAKQLFFAALAHQEKAQLRQAEQLYEEALELAPNRPSIMNNLAAVYILSKKYLQAKHLCERCLALDPQDPEALVNLGIALVHLDAAQEAVELFNAILTRQPDHAQALLNLGSTLQSMGREDEANAVFQSAIERCPNDVQCVVGYGDALRTQHRLDAAVEQLQRALEREPQHAQAHYGLGLVRLLQRDYEHAWPEYEWRLECEEFRRESFRSDPASVSLYQTRPRWKGPQQPQSGTVALWAEQGIGEEVLFSTLLPEIKDACNTFVCELDRRLIGIYRRAFPQTRFVVRQDPPERELQEADCVLAAGSLPAYFRKGVADFARQPRRLVAALPERVAHYRRRLAHEGSAFNIAIAWRSTRDHWRAQRKSAPLDAFSPLLKLTGVRLVDVQYGDTRSDRQRLEAKSGAPIVRFDDLDHTNNLEDLFAILEACDLVITTSNATAHFAGALGRPTWLLYLAARPPFHYWAHRGDYRCLWYPSVEIVTAPQLTDWSALIEHVAQKLITTTG